MRKKKWNEKPNKQKEKEIKNKVVQTNHHLKIRARDQKTEPTISR